MKVTVSHINKQLRPADFSLADLKSAYRSVGVEYGRSVYVTGNLGRLGWPTNAAGTPLSKRDVLAAHCSALRELVGPNAAVVFPTHSWGLVQKDIVFDPLETPTEYPLSEFMRKQPDARRLAHPFASVAAIGDQAAELIPSGLSRHPYGAGSVFEKLIEREALHVSIGLPARNTISAVHHCEQMAGVPYRYTKCFHHPMMLGGVTAVREVFLFVVYRGIEIERDKNRKIMALPAVVDTLRSVSLGRSGLESVDLGVFGAEVISAMRDDPYLWLRRRPEKTPWIE